MMRPDHQNQPPTAQTAEPAAGGNEWLIKSREAYDTSTSYIDLNFRKQWEDGIRAFNSQHPADSKYSSPNYAKRSNIFRPKTRSVIRKNEAAAASAFFSNMDVVDIKAVDESNSAQMASADVMKSLLEYRLHKSIPWFQTVQGGIQEAQVSGTVGAHVHWDYKTREETRTKTIKKTIQPDDPEYPNQEKVPQGAFVVGSERQPVEIEVTENYKIRTAYTDKPCVKLIPVENIRIDPACDWIDPINSSPYVIELIPMYVMDVKAMIETGEWLAVSEEAFHKASQFKLDTTRVARERSKTDPTNPETRAYRDIDIVWVQRHIHRDGDGQDMSWFTLDRYAMLTDPVPLEEVEFHGQRPYVLGTFILEAFKAFSTGVPALNKGLQDEANEIANQRLDNVKFALNKKWFAKRGKNVDVSGLVRNVPGGVVMMDDPTNDVREISWPDVTGSAFEEQNRINLDMDELLGNFNPAALIMAGGANAPARNMAMLSQSTGTLVEYGIRTFVETFIQPILRLLMKLEQYYETDEVILALAGKKAQLFQRYGIDQVTDDLLNQELTLNVNVGMGATDPTQKLQKFLTAMNSFATLAKMQIPDLNLNEVGKEIFGHLGYRESSRFFTTDDPNAINLKNQLQQAMGEIAKLQGQVKEKQTQQVVGLQKTRETNASKERIAEVQEDAANKRALATHITAMLQAAWESEHNGRISKPSR